MSAMGFVKHERGPGWLKLADGSVWTDSVAVVRGLVIKDGEVNGNVYVQERSLPAATWIQQGDMDEACAKYVLALPQSKNPQPPVAMVSHRAAQSIVTFDEHSPEGRAVAALIAFLESPMENGDKAALARTLRAFARGACAISGR